MVALQILFLLLGLEQEPRLISGLGRFDLHLYSPFTCFEFEPCIEVGFECQKPTERA